LADNKNVALLLIGNTDDAPSILFGESNLLIVALGWDTGRQKGSLEGILMISASLSSCWNQHKRNKPPVYDNNSSRASLLCGQWKELLGISDQVILYAYIIMFHGRCSLSRKQKKRPFHSFLKFEP
jgi:hypothetical protein